MAERITIGGQREVSAAFDALAKDVADLSEAHKRVAALIVPGAGRRSPRRTGALAASWRAEASKIAAGVVSGVPYAGPVEYGARGIPGARMVADTVAEQADAIVEEYDKAITERGKRRGFDTD
jgi:hypothetical protein